MTARILVADDDPHIREVIVFALERAGMTVTLAGNGREALAAHRRERPDLVVLDIAMPELDGFETLRAIRQASATPVIFLTARDEEIDRVLGLELGGDDYVTKPFSPRELVARIRAVLKRSSAPIAMPEDAGAALAHGALSLDREAHSARFGGHDLALTALEFSILAALMRRSTKAFTREELVSAAWPSNIFVSDRTVDSHVRNLRAKLARAGAGAIIETVRGIGYRLGRGTAP